MTISSHANAPGIQLTAVVLRSLGESALESADKTGVMSISDRVSNFLDRKVTSGEKLGRLLQPSFRHEATKLSARLLPEQSLEMSWTERYLQREIPHRTRRLRFDHFDHLTETSFLNLKWRLSVPNEIGSHRFQ